MKRQMAAMAVAICLAGPAWSQGKAALGGLGKGLSDLSNKYIEQELAIERAKALAEIEIETARRMRENEEKAARQRAQKDPVDEQIELLDRVFPKWDVLINSKAFQTWLPTRPDSYQRVCKTTPHARVMLSCINDFLATPFASL